MLRRFLFSWALLCASLVPAVAQHADLYKLSPMLRRLAVSQRQDSPRRVAGRASTGRRAPRVCAFIRLTADADSLLAAHGCRSLARFGDIHIADIPLSELSALSRDRRVSRIEARRGTRVLMDSTALHIDALPVYAGASLPQAYTGSGVVVGIEDIGFDLTHPNFYSRDLSDYRIRRLWDQLSADTIGSRLYVGRDYTTRADLLDLGHSCDGLKQYHGTHTLGIAAGSGYDSAYRGMAPESDICLVANATSEDIEFVDSADYYKYTYATDALGFKYIFDYARSQDKPCVISFSEGSPQDYWGYDQLYYAILDSLTGPGRIIVSSAGNDGGSPTYLHKSQGTSSTGAFLRRWGTSASLTLKSTAPFTMRYVVYGSRNDTLTINTADVTATTDSIRYDTLQTANQTYVVCTQAYPSCYNADETAFDISLVSQPNIGVTYPLSFEVSGTEADVECHVLVGEFSTSERNPALQAGQQWACVNSPSSAPGVICVGATNWRDAYTNYKGRRVTSSWGALGGRASFSSIGPTYDGRVKPDVLGPGSNVISSMSSYYLEENPGSLMDNSSVERFDFSDRTYAWAACSGTSMSSPAVAGAIALWLEAKPTLTRDDLLDVFAHTCTRSSSALSYPNNYEGYGEIDVYRGLLYILGINGVSGLSTHQPLSVKIAPVADGRVRIDFDEPPVQPFTARVYSVQGLKVAEQHFAAGLPTVFLDLATLPHGVYAVQVDGSTAATTGSSLIRR